MNQKKDIRINLSEVSERLDYTDYRATKNWLTKKNIPMKKVRGKWTVFEYFVEFQIQLELAEELKQTYPNTWFERYDTKTEDKNMVKAILISLPITDKRVKKLKVNSNLKKYIS